jgi:hypothetical protein
MRLVFVKTEDFEGEIIWLYEMPMSRMLELEVEDPVKRVALIVKLLSDAIVSDNTRKEFEALSFENTMNVVHAWFSADPADIPSPSTFREMDMDT